MNVLSRILFAAADQITVMVIMNVILQAMAVMI